MSMKQALNTLARFMAVLGGLVLICLIALTCLSVIGRGANTLGHSDFVKTNVIWLSDIMTKLGPINGDFELVEIGIAFTVLAFFPWCSVNQAHARVEIFSGIFGPRLTGFLDKAWESIFALALGLITWRLFVGMQDKYRYGETSFLIEIPIWWGYAACFMASLIAFLVAVGCVVYKRDKAINLMVDSSKKRRFYE